MAIRSKLAKLKASHQRRKNCDITEKLVTARNTVSSLFLPGLFVGSLLFNVESSKPLLLLAVQILVSFYVVQSVYAFAISETTAMIIYILSYLILDSISSKSVKVTDYSHYFFCWKCSRLYWSILSYALHLRSMTVTLGVPNPSGTLVLISVTNFRRVW